MARLPKFKDRLGTATWRRWVVFGALLLFLAFGLYKVQRVWRRVQSLQDRLDSLQAVADGNSDLGLGEAGESLRGAYTDLKGLRAEVGFLLPLSRFLGWVPGVGGELKTAPALFDVALSVTEAGTMAFDGLEPLVPLTESGDGKGQPLARALEILADAQLELEAAQARLAAAVERRSEIDTGALSPRTASLVAQLDRYLPLMQTALDGGRLLPDLLGASGRRTYLMLAQNNDELRATGGFISAVGLLVLEDGEIVEIVFEDSYAVDDFSHPYPDSPPPFVRYMGIDLWVFRDANWSPDFPTAAQQAVELYSISRELAVDGVLAVDQHALQTIIAALAPLEVKDWPEPVTGENVISLIRLAWSPTDVEDQTGFDARWWRHRKSFIGDLVGAMQARLEEAPDQVNWLTLARAFFQVLDERHLQVWLTDSNGPGAHLLATGGWDGAVRPANGDYLMVVDTNMGYNKANAIVQESLDYRVLVNADGTAQATLAIRHMNPGSDDVNCEPGQGYGTSYDDLINRCYWDYVRVYTPDGSQLLAATAHPIRADLLVTGQRQSGAGQVLPMENSKTVFGSFFVLPRGQETETRFVYQLPQEALERKDDRWCYRLLVQKQAGTYALPLRVALALPPGSSVQSVTPGDGAGGGTVSIIQDAEGVVFDTALAQDQDFEVCFQPERW